MKRKQKPGADYDNVVELNPYRTRRSVQKARQEVSDRETQNDLQWWADRVKQGPLFEDE